MIVYKSVKDKYGNIILFDIFIDRLWVGSRRTMEQAELQTKVYDNESYIFVCLV